MRGSVGGRAEETTVREGVAPGRLTALLEEIAAAPDAELGGAWESALRPGDVVGKFELVRELGRGGFGIVWEARDRELGRAVAFKAVRAGRSDAAREGRLVAEAEAAAKLSHPNIVTLFDAGCARSGPYLVMELLRGETLARRLARGRLPLSEAMPVAVEIANGLAHAHARGVVHRDLKPENVFLCDDGQVKVLDFGLAHVFGRRPEAAGTSGYMAPEQREGAPEDERTDVFALGVVLFEMLAGEHPSRGRGRTAAALDVPGAPALARLVERMLAERPVDRPRHGGEVAEALLSVASAFAGSSSQALARARRRRFHAGRRAVVAGAALLVCVVAAAVAWSTWRRDHGARPEGPTGVAVADFANETGEPELDGLSGLLITSLEQSRKLRVLTRSRMFDVLKELGRTGVERIDEPLAREIGRRTNVRALLHASVRRLGDTYVVDLRALDPTRDEYLFALRDTADRQSALLPLVDRLSERVRLELRESDREIRASERRVATAITSELAAYQHYFRGQHLLDRRDLSGAAEEYRRALEADPAFALAHYGLSVCMRFAGGSMADRLVHAEAAAAAADRLPEKEALLVRAWAARQRGRIDEAREAYAKLVERFPEDREGLVWAANHEFNNFLDHGRALALYERALRVDPTSILIRGGIGVSMMQLGRLDDAAAFVRANDAGWPDAPCLLAAIELNRKRADAAQDAADRCAAATLQGRATAFWVHLLRDDLAAASADIEALRAAGDEAEAAWLSAYHALARGRVREAIRLGEDASAAKMTGFAAGLHRLEPLLAARGPSAALTTSIREGKARAHNDNEDTGLLMALVGDYELARELVPEGFPALRWDRTLIDALAQRSERGLDATRAILADLARTEVRWRKPIAAYALAETCSLAKDPRCVLDAASSFRFATEYSLQMGGPLHIWGWPRVQLWSALAHEALGEREKALEQVEALLRRWKDADLDLTLLHEAKALRDRLAPARERGRR